MYGAISEVEQYGKWYMLVARVVTGLGVGNLAALRAYGATASTPKDRLKAISYGTAGFVFGISFGPAISVGNFTKKNVAWQNPLFFNMKKISKNLKFYCILTFLLKKRKFFDKKKNRYLH